MMLHFLFSRRKNAAEETIPRDTPSSNDQNSTVNLNENESEDDSVAPPTKIARFDLEPKTSEKDWSLSEPLAKYIHKYMDLKISEKEIR